VRSCGADLFLSGNRTCELGLEHDSGEPYESVLIALERLTRPQHLRPTAATPQR
jgi:D-lactate dehydrogenase